MINKKKIADRRSRRTWSLVGGKANAKVWEKKNVSLSEAWTREGRLFRSHTMGSFFCKFAKPLSFVPVFSLFFEIGRRIGRQKLQSRLYFKSSMRDIGKSFQQAITAPRLDLIGYGTTTAQSWLGTDTDHSFYERFSDVHLWDTNSLRWATIDWRWN